MPIFDYVCNDCNCSFEELVLKNEEIRCKKCNSLNVNKTSPKKMCFKLSYNNKKDTCGWSFNNYESSRYWDDVNKARSEGKEVKPAYI